MAGGRVVGYSASANACSEFASRSRQSSIPTEMRNNPSVTRASAISCALLPDVLRYREGVTEARFSLPTNGAETLVIDTGISGSASPSCPCRAEGCLVAPPTTPCGKKCCSRSIFQSKDEHESAMVLMQSEHENGGCGRACPAMLLSVFLLVG